jgi:hypothetical protein
MCRPALAPEACGPLNAGMDATLRLPPRFRRPPVQPRLAARRCLVVTGDARLRGRIRAAALAAGSTCSDPGDAAALAAAGTSFDSVFIDAVRPPPGVAAALADVVGWFAADSAARVVVLGAADKPEEEIRMRQFGVCAYVPGAIVGPGLSALVRDVCR